MNEHIRFITVGFADMINNLPDPDVMASDPSLQDYWPDVCDTCQVHEGHEPSCPNNRDNEADAYDLCERDLWDASRDQPDPDIYEATGDE